MDPGLIVGLSVGLAVLVLLILVFGCKFAKKGEKDKHDIAKEKLLGSGPVHRQRSDTTMSTEYLRNEKGSNTAEKSYKQKEGKRKSVTFNEKEWPDEQNHYDQPDQNNFDYSYYEPKQRLFTEYLRSNNIKKQRICSEYKDGVCQVDEVHNDSECSNRKNYTDRGRKHLKKDNQTVDKPQSSIKTGIKSYVSEKVNAKRGEKHRRKYKNKAETTERKHALTRQPSVKQILEEVKRSSKLSRQNGTCITVNSRKEFNKIADKTYPSVRHRSSEESNREWSRPKETVQTVNAEVRAEMPTQQTRYTDYESYTLRQEIDGSRPEYGEGRPAVPIKPAMGIRADRSHFVQTAFDMENSLPPVRNNSFTEALSTWVLHSERAEKIPRPPSSIIYTTNQVKPKSSFSNQRKIDISTSFDLTCETEPNISHQDFSQWYAPCTSTGCSKSSYMNPLPNEPSTYPQELQPKKSSQEQLKTEKHPSPSANVQLLADAQDSPTTSLKTRASKSSPSKRVSSTTYQESRSPETVHHKQQSPKTNPRLHSPQRPFNNGLLPATNLQDPSEPQQTHASDQSSPKKYLQSAEPQTKQQVLETTSLATRTSSTSSKKQIWESNVHSQTPIFLRTKLSPESYQQDQDINTEQSLSSIHVDNSKEQVSATSISVDQKTEQPLASIPVYHRKKQLSASTLDDQKMEKPSTFIPVDNRKEQPSTIFSPSYEIPVKSATYDKIPTSVTTVSKYADMESSPRFERRPMSSPLKTSPAEIHDKQFYAVELSDSVISERKDFQGKDSLYWITTESDFNPGQTSTPHQSKTDVPGSTILSNFNHGQTPTHHQSKTDVPGITSESDFNPGQTSTPHQSKTDVPGITTLSNFNHGQTPTPHQSKTDVPGITTESDFNSGQTLTPHQTKSDVPGIRNESDFNSGQTSTPDQSKKDVPGITAESDFKSGQTSTHHQIKTEFRGNINESDFNPEHTATLEESKTKIPGITSGIDLNPDQTSTYEQSLTEVLANSNYQTNHRTVLHSILKKRRGLLSLSGQDLSRNNSDDTMLSVKESSSVNRTLSSPRVDQLETPAKNDRRDRVFSVLPEKLATVKDIRKDPDIHALVEHIKARRKSSSGSS